jgi:CTP synthase (UTP-ammonia lyase)
MEAGLPAVARGPAGEVRAIESPAHKFFLATLFQPQLSSTVKKPHPVVVGFVQAAAEFAAEKPDANILE